MALSCRQWQRWLRPAVVVGYVLLMLIVVPLTIAHLVKEKAQKHVIAWFVAGIFVLATLPISLWDISQHLVHYNRPELQRYYIRIIWMVPIYSLDSWLALRFPDYAVYFDTLRECYEAYVIYNFIQLLLTYLQHREGEDQTALTEIFHRHMFPVKYVLNSWPPGEPFVRRCTLGALQYTLIRVLTTITALICAVSGRYKDGKISANNAWVYLMVINNLSQFWAMYCLVLFYHAAKEPLQGLKPLPKFLCVKLVVFFSFWQAVLIAIIGKLGWIPESSNWTSYSKETVETSIQDFIICIEMFFAAIAHHYSFSHVPFIDYAADTPTCWQNVIQMWNVSDIQDDIVTHTREIVKQRRKKKTDERTEDDERVGLLDDGARPLYNLDEVPVTNDQAGASNALPSGRSDISSAQASSVPTLGAANSEMNETDTAGNVRLRSGPNESEA